MKRSKAKSEAAEDSLKGTEELKKSNESLKKDVAAMKGEIAKLKKSYSEWDKKFKDLWDASARSKKELDKKLPSCSRRRMNLKNLPSTRLKW